MAGVVLAQVMGFFTIMGGCFWIIAAIWLINPTEWRDLFCKDGFVPLAGVLIILCGVLLIVG